MKHLIKRIAAALGGLLFDLGSRLMAFGHDWGDIIKRHREWHDTIPDAPKIPDEAAPRKRHAWN